ncbi:MAG: HAD family phosphatase [Acidobacteriaceae bacterium]|nr:HAD family phosphatase [Acidobacteriaceae bacterium]
MALVNKYDGIIFDYGGVLVQHQTEEDQRRLAQLAGVPADNFTDLYWATRAIYDKGELTAADYWRDLAREAGAPEPDQITIDRLTELDTESWMQFDPAMWEWVNELRASGRRVAILSNMPRDLGEALRSRTNRLEQFDQVTLSYEINAVKPEAEIYEHCLEGLNTARERTLFLDDRIENVHGAQLVGIAAQHFVARDDMLLRLRS